MRFPNDTADKSETFVTVERDHWEKNWQQSVGKRPLSLLNIFNRDAIALLSRPIRGEDNPVVVEIGFVPGKYLRYIEETFKAECHGFDYSEIGCRMASQFFSEQGSSIHVHHQDVLITQPQISKPARLVYSIGVVEHFENPVEMIKAHLAPLAHDGVAIIILPNYQGMNLWIQKSLDPNNIKIHNLKSMTTEFWESCANEFPEFDFKTQKFGRLNPWMFSLWRIGKIGKVLQLGINFASFLLPKNIETWSSMFVIEIRRR